MKNTVQDSYDQKNSVEVCSEISSLEVAGSEAVALTTFEQEACTTVMALGRAYTPSASVFPEDKLQDLTKYFSRPRLISSGSLPVSSGLVTSQSLTPSTILSTLFPSSASRMEGVFGYRCTFVFTLQLAAHPFQAGLLALAFQYGPQLNDVFDRTGFTFSCTNVPHVLMDVSESTMVQLKLPYSYVYEYLPVGTTGITQPYGTLRLQSILPTELVAGTVSPTYNLYVHMEDLQLFGSTSENVANITLQSGIHGEEDSQPFTGTSLKSPALRMISRGVPSLSSIPRPLSFALSAASNLAKAFGYSQVNSSDPVMRMHAMPGVAETNVDLASPAVVMGPYSTTSVVTRPGFSSSDVDEMSFEYVLSQWSQIHKISMTSSVTQGTYVYGCLISPGALWYREAAGYPAGNVRPPQSNDITHSCFFPSHIFNLAQNFRYWKGGFRFRVTFAKTKFHTGRMLLAYEPNYGSNFGVGDSAVAYPAGALVAGAPQPYVYSKIFDFRDGNTVEFDVPYISPQPYSFFYENTGIFTMCVLDPLNRPTTVVDRVYALVEVCALPDFELSCLRSPLYPATGPVVNASVIRLQSGISTNTDSATAPYIIGERVRSVKTMISVPKVSFPLTLGGATTSSLSIFPWFYHPNQVVTVPATGTIKPESFGFGGNLATCYLYAKGGTNMHFYVRGATDAQPNSGVTSTLCAHPRPWGIGTPTGKDVLVGSSSNNPRITVTNGTPLHANLPFYGRFERTYASAFNGVDWSGGGILGVSAYVGYPSYTFVPTNTPVITNFVTSSTNWKAHLSRSAADDAALGFYMGPTPLVLSSSTSIQTSYDIDGQGNLSSATAS